jgi:hypothetical protein
MLGQAVTDRVGLGTFASMSAIGRAAPDAYL